MTDPDHRSLLEQLGSDLRATIHYDAPEEWATEVGVKPIRFTGAEANWTEMLGPARNLMPKVPGHYHLCFRVGEVVVATKDLSIRTFRSAAAAVQAAVRTHSEVAEVAFSAVNHRGVTVPLHVVAEDYSAINATVILTVPQPDPLVSETRHGLDLVLHRDGREFLREHRRIALKPGRRRATLSLKLSPLLFGDGPGLYRLS